MPEFDEKSRMELGTCHPKLQRIFMSAIKITNFSILEGHRPDSEQEKLFNEGKSKIKSGGKHNTYPSEAGDVAPKPYPKMDNPKDVEQIFLLVGIIKGIAHMMGIQIRLGADFNGNGDIRDDKWIDAFHVELDKSEV
jgi:peptidoglycan L-alanyl-D-glutamate endopeptidase CwlK